MATGKMSFNYYQNGKYGMLPQNPQKDMEVTQDMHLKMSKKIAQLTKVIYALNTKNDENEAVLQSAHDQHEEEKQQILTDMQTKLKQFKSRLEGETERSQQVSNLQKRLSEFEHQKNSAEESISHLKTEATLWEQQRQQEYSRHLQQLSQDVLRAKREFEEHLKAFEKWKLETEAEHLLALKELESRHSKDLEDLHSFQHSRDSDWLNRCAQIEEKCNADIFSFQKQLCESQAERLKLEEDYTQKLQKAQAFFDKELQAAQCNQNSQCAEELARLRTQQESLQKDFSAQELQLRKQIDRLVRQLAETENLAESRKQELSRLEAELGDRNSNAESITQMLQSAEEESTTARARLREMEMELAASKERITDQAADLLKKSGLIGELEAVKLQKTTQVQYLTQTLDSLQLNMSKLQAERASLQTQQKELTSEQQSQLSSLKQTLEDVMVEKETMRQRYERQLSSLQQEMEERLSQTSRTLEEKLETAEKQYKEECQRDRKAAEETLAQTTQNLQAQFSEECAKLQSEREIIQAEFERVKVDLLSRCEEAEREVERLSAMVRESEQGLGSASTHISSLKEAAAALKTELDKTSSELRESRTHSANLQDELVKLQTLQKNKSSEWQLELKARLHKLAEELDAKWSETMRSECHKLREELTAQKDDEKSAALEHLSKLKDEAFTAERVGFEKHLSHLNRQLEELRNQLDKAHSASKEQQSRLEAELQAQHIILQKDMLQAAQDYSNKIDQLEKMHQVNLQKTIQTKDAEKAEHERELQLQYQEDLNTQLSAHKWVLQAAQQTAEQNLQAKLQEAEDRFNQQQDELRTDLQERLNLELENLRQSHSLEVRTARMELERAVEISKQKDEDHQMRMDELQEEISQRETHIIKLKEEIKQLQAAISSLKKTLVDRDSESHRMQTEFRQQLRQVEEHLKREHKLSLDNLSADHLHEAQEMISQFSSAQAMLKDKISQLQLMLVEAEERYNQRDSRPEDLELIQQLRAEVLERETRVKDLIEEKKFYQLELVNRETNFNKVFSTSPNVGVLNPLSFKSKRKGDKKHSSAPSLGIGVSSSQQRLEPLPNSPIHDSALNPSKPLPQPGIFSKKFVK